MKVPHKPVLIHEVVNLFSSIESGTVIDCTVGFGGHSEALLESNHNINLICIDQDQNALNFSKKRLSKYGDRVKFLKGRFSEHICKFSSFSNITGILADIGVSSYQLDSYDRGFSFHSDELDMRMDNSLKLTAKDIVNGYSLSELERVFKDFGEIRNYKKVASMVVKRREEAPFQSSKELANFISKHFFQKRSLHPATLVFQAIRIEVNDELGELKRLLKCIKKSTINKSIVAIISFHSLEDRIVKQTFREWSKSCVCPKEYPRCLCGNNNSFGMILTKKPIIPTEREIYENPRSRSSKLRAFKIQYE